MQVHNGFVVFRSRDQRCVAQPFGAFVVQVGVFEPGLAVGQLGLGLLEILLVGGWVNPGNDLVVRNP
jgi:hypothetical protein